MSTERCSLLIVAAEPGTLDSLVTLLAKDFEVLTAHSGVETQCAFDHREIDLIVTDQRLPDANGVELLAWVRQRSPRTIGLLLAGPGGPAGLVHANDRVQEQTRALEEANHLLQQRLRELETLALTDPLTGLLNRRAIDDIVKAELRRHARYHSPLAIGMIDADNFREINRRHLLPGGDQALIHLARTLTGSLRTVDTVGRIGGEEFLVIAPETGVEGAAVLAERMRANVESRPTSYNDASIPLTVSIGFAVAEENVPTEHDQIKHAAAAALGEAKAAGRNCCVVRYIKG